MRRGLTIAALMAGFVTMSTLPAAAQGWGYYEGWNGPPRGFGISIGFGSPYYGNWGYGGYGWVRLLRAGWVRLLRAGGLRICRMGRSRRLWVRRSNLRV